MAMVALEGLCEAFNHYSLYMELISLQMSIYRSVTLFRVIMQLTREFRWYISYFRLICSWI